MPNPHRSHSGFDYATRTHHCISCDIPVSGPTETLENHVLINWEHWLWAAYPAVLATDEDGKTIETEVAIPARRELSLLPSHNGISYCDDCMFVLTQPEAAVQYGCGICGLPVDLKEEHSRAELLWKRAVDQYNGPFRVVVFHIECLPTPEFDAVRQEREERQSKVR